MSRPRLTKEDAQELILSVAEKRFENNGLEGLKLADIAKEAGITHSNILHHFGSRDGLHAVLMQRLTTRLASQILKDIEQSTDTQNRTGNLQTLFETLSQKGHARLLVWLLTADPKGEKERALVASLRPLLDQLQTVMRERYKDKVIDDPTQMRYFLLLVTTAAVGDGLAGGLLKEALRLKEADEAFNPESYLEWLADTVLP